MAEFTGLNPLVAKSNIGEFNDQGMTIFYDLSYYNKLFIDSLSSVWFSPNAVNFGKTFTPELYNSEAQTQVLVNNTIVSCVAAYNALATSQGLPAIPDDRAAMSVENYAPQGTNMQYNDMLDISPDGDVVMDKTKVTAYLNEYRNNLNLVQSELDGFPLSIAFYDPAGEIQAAFTSAVTTLKEKLEANYSSIAAEIGAKLVEETDKVVSGARNAASVMSTGTTA